MANQRKEFSKIYDKYIDKIFRFIILKVNSEEIAQDLTSETFLRGWQAYKNPQKKIENPSAFLYRIARNLVTDHYREKGRTKIVSTESLPIIDPGQSMEEKAFFNSDLDKIKVVLADLREDYQNIIILHYLEDLSVNEMAKIMGKTEQACRVQLHRALRSLKNEINRQA